MIKSPLKYPGSKTRAIPQIAPLIPNFKEYRECFLGGGSVFLYIKQIYGNDKKYWINDLYYELFNFWRQLQQNSDEMCDLLYRMTSYYGSQDQGKIMQQYLKINWHRWNDIQKAVAYYILNNISFSGFARGFSQSNFEKFKAADYKKDLLKDVSILLQGTDITNYDYSKLIDAQPSDGIDDNDVWIYLDPPYYNVKYPELYGKSGNQNLHAKFDHQRFVDVMKGCKHNWLMTYDNSNTIKRLFDWANVVEWELTYTSRHVKTGKELFISNMDISVMKDNQLSIDDAWS